MGGIPKIAVISPPPSLDGTTSAKLLEVDWGREFQSPLSDDPSIATCMVSKEDDDKTDFSKHLDGHDCTSDFPKKKANCVHTQLRLQTVDMRPR